MFDEFRYGAGAGGGARKQGGTAAQPARVSHGSSDDHLIATSRDAQVFVIGGNESTLALVNSLRPAANGAVTVRSLPLARTPAGIAVGEGRQDAGVSLAGIVDWIDRTFPPDDDHAFVASMRDLELLARVGWESPMPESLDERSILNAEDLPDEIVDALAAPPVALAQCETCRRLCVRGDFVWKEKQFCAWDYHARIFGRRGPWRRGPYEERHFETLPSCAYIAPPLLQELGVEAVMAGATLAEPTLRGLVNTILEADPERSHLAVRADDGIWVLREA